jgi:hypothetical protein
MRELDQVILAIDIPEHGLQRGDIGVVLAEHFFQGGGTHFGLGKPTSSRLIHSRPNTHYEVEFVAINGDLLAILLLDSSEIRPSSNREIAHVRPIGRLANNLSMD